MIEKSKKKHSIKKIEFDDLIQNMLEFNPNIRWSAEQCLNHEIFDEIKTSENEDIYSPFKACCTVDDQEVGNTTEECMAII